MTSSTAWKTEFDNELLLPVYAKVLEDNDLKDPTLPEHTAFTIASTPVRLATLSLRNLKVLAGEIISPHVVFPDYKYLPRLALVRNRGVLPKQR